DGALVGRLFGSDLRAAAGRGLGRRAVAQAVLEALHGAPEIRPDVLELLGAEHQDDDQQHDHPVPDAEGTHDVLLTMCRFYGQPVRQGRGPPMTWTCRWKTSCPPSCPVLMTV